MLSSYPTIGDLLESVQHTPMGYSWLGEGWPDEVGSQRSSRDFDVRIRLAAERAARIVAGLRMCPLDRPRPVAPMGASRARDVNGSRCRRGSAWFRSDDRSCSVRAVFELPSRSDRGSRRADDVVSPTTLCSRQDLTVIAPLGFKVHRQMRRQGGEREARRSGRVANREGGDHAEVVAGHHPGSAAHRRDLAVRACCGANLLHGLLAESSSSRRPDRVPEAARSLAPTRLLRQQDDERVLHARDLAGGRTRGEGDTACIGRRPC